MEMRISTRRWGTFRHDNANCLDRQPWRLMALSDFRQPTYLLSWGWQAVGSFCCFVPYFMFVASYVSFVECCTSCRITSREGYTITTRWGRTRAILLLQAWGIFLPPVRVFFALRLIFSGHLFLCSCSVSLYISFPLFCLFLLYFILFSFTVLFSCVVFNFVLFECIGV